MNIKLIAAALVVSTTFFATFALAQTQAPARATPAAKTQTGDWQSRAKAAIAPTLQKYRYQYKLAADQQAKLEKVLIAQYKDVMDFDKIRAAKIKAVDDQIAAVNEKVEVLNKEIAALEKNKAVYSKERAELLLDHKAELNNVFTEQQRVAYVLDYLKNSTVHRYWGGFSEAQQAKLTEQFEAAALKVVQAAPGEADKVFSAVCKELRGAVGKLVTPEVRQAGEIKYMTDGAIRAFYRIKLTDSQKDQIRELCGKAAKRKGELEAQFRQLDKDRDAVRKSMHQYSTSDYYRKIRKEISEKILTEEQRKAGSSRSSRSRSGSSSRKRSGGSSTKKPTRPAAKTPK